MRAARRPAIQRKARYQAGFLLLWAAPAFGANYAVTPGSGDTVDIVHGDEVCDDGTGTCSLRAAIQESNATAAPDTIAIPAGTFQLTIDPGSPEDGTGDLDVSDDVTISGAGIGTTVIEQTDADRVFDFGIATDEA